MLSLTKTTEFFLKHYNLGTENISNDEIIWYNTHKLRHSIGVLETGRNLLLQIKENEKIDIETIKKTEIVLLLHDIARFHQNDKTKILKRKEFEHGDKSYNILKKEGYEENICLAVKYHNKFNLEGLFKEKTYLEMSFENQKETLFLSKIVRDADKLQNMLYSIFDIDKLFRSYENKYVKEGISQEVLEDFQNKVSVDYKNVKSKSDSVLSFLCRTFDLNFSESIEMLKYYSFFEKIIFELEKLPSIKKEDIKIIKNIILDYKI